jgi:hypothetical protein
MVFLGDFNKAVQDLIKTKKFKFHRSLEVKADSKNQFSWTAKTTVDPMGRQKSEVVFTQKEANLGDMKCTFKSPDCMEIEASSKETPLSNLKIKVAQDVIECSGEYGCGDWAAKTKIVSKKSSVSLTPDFYFNATDEWTVGANAVVTMDGGLNDYGFGIRYMTKSKQHFSVQAKNKLDSVCIAGSLAKTDYFGKIGAQIDLNQIQSGTPSTAVTVGGLLDLEERANLRWKFDVNAKNLAMAYEYKFANNFSGCFSSSVGTDMKMTPLGMKFDVSL